jgi:integrase
MKVVFSIPKVCKSKYWYVYFRYNKKQYRYKYGINNITDLKERELEANLLKDALYTKLKNGWNPELPDIITQQSDLSLCAALDFALEKKTPSLGKKTVSGYTGSINFIKQAIKDLRLEPLQVVDCKRVHVKMIIEKAKENRNWTNKAYNKHLNHFKAVLSELIQWDIIEANPAHNIKNMPTAEVNANNPASDKDIELIKKELLQKSPNFYIFCIALFHTGIRPEELLSLRLSMVDLGNNEIILPAEITKTNKIRIVPINPFLKKELEAMNFEKLPKDFFLFGSNREAGKGNIGKHLDFIPAPTKIKRDTATKRWYRIVKTGLGIDMNLYALKHLGANKKILAGLELDTLRELYGHTSKLMTVKYAKVVTEVYRKQILENSPDF